MGTIRISSGAMRWRSERRGRRDDVKDPGRILYIDNTVAASDCLNPTR